MMTRLSKDEALEIAEGLRQLFKRGFVKEGHTKRAKAGQHDYLMMVALLPVHH
jgi:hypothetical protein